MQNAEEPVHEYMAQKSHDGVVLATVPFSSKLKKSIIAIRHPGLHDTVRVYVKGAPEVVVPNCNFTYGEGPQPDKLQMTDEDRNKIFEHFGEMTSHAMRCIALSYCDLSQGQFEELMASMQGEIDDENEIANLEGNDQTFLALVALKDPLRTNIKKVIENSNESRINLILVSGDNLTTSAGCACDVGILDKDQFEMIRQRPSDNGVGMDATVFAQLVGDVVT
jgi:magnesium-transporting ATPase (P-type)